MPLSWLSKSYLYPLALISPIFPASVTSITINPLPSPPTAHLFYSRCGVEGAQIGEVQEGSGGDEEIGVPAEVRGILVDDADRP